MDDLGGLSMRQLRLFVVLHRRLHMGEAAAELSITQSAASRRLAELEAALGEKLFRRQGRGLVPTAAGDTFLRYAEAALRKLGSGLRALSQAEPAQAPLRIGALPSVESALMPRVVTALRERLRNLPLRVDTGTGDQMLPRLRAGALDALIGRMPVLGESLRFWPLYEDRLQFFARPDHPLTQGSPTPADLLDYPLVLPPPSAVIRPAIEDFFASRGAVMPRDVTEIASPLIVAPLLRATDAVWGISQGAAHGLGLAQLGFDTVDTVGAIGLTIRVEDNDSTELQILLDVLRTVHSEIV
ncbi:MAG: LysR substrate-binding domain-containing protein [Paracoccaceae bacterium]|nr:LysR substrate-binding domain-containing protein [Paracoccaceae bacterium]